MYAADCSYKDGATTAGLSGRAMLVDYIEKLFPACLLYTSDAADERSSVDLGGRRIIKKKTEQHETTT